MDDETEKRIRHVADAIDEKVRNNKESIGYPLHYELHSLVKKIYQILEESESDG